MDVTQRLRAGRRLAVCLGALGSLLVWVVAPTPMDRDEAVRAAHLGQPASSAALSLDGRRWTIRGAHVRVVVDAQTGVILQREAE